MKLRICLHFFLAVGVCVTACPVHPWTTVGDGIEYQAFTTSEPNNLFVARMSRSNTNATIDTTIAQGTISGAREVMSAQASRYDDALTWWGGSWGRRNDVVVAINGGFFDMSTGLITGGQIQSGWYAHWFADRYTYTGAFSGLAWKNDRTIFHGECVTHQSNKVYVRYANGNTQALAGINESEPLNNRLYIYTPQYNNRTPAGTRTEVLVEMSTPNLTTSGAGYTSGTIRSVVQNTGSTWIPFDHLVLSASGDAGGVLLSNSTVGASVRIYQELYERNEPDVRGQGACQTPTGVDWSNVFSAINTNFHFLENGIVRVPDAVAHPGYIGYVNLNPRTAICWNSDYVFFVVCDGRSSQSIGMSCARLGEWARDTLGATDGVNLDGGGSSTMIVNGTVMNNPSDGSERAVCNGVIMVNLAPKVQSTTFSAGQTVTTSSSANVRLGPGTNYGIRTTVSSGATGTVQSHFLNGVLAKGYNWWKVNFSGTVGWIAESLLVRPTSPPSILQQPVSTAVCAGGTATFSVVASGTQPLSYQWRKGTVSITDGGHYSGATTATLTVSNCDSGDVASNYNCYVTNAYGTVTTNNVSLTVNAIPAAPTSPAANPSTITAGQSSTLSASVGSGETVDWYAGSCGGTLVGSGTSLSVSPTSTTTYYPRARNTISGCVSASCGTAVAVTVNAPPNALLNPGFEYWAGAITADHWTQYSVTGSVACYKGSSFSGSPPVSPHGGSECQRVKLDSNGERGGVYQQFSSTPGVTYTVSAWLLTRVTSTSQAQARLGVENGARTTPSSPSWSDYVTGDSAWTKKTLNIQATGTTVTVFLEGYHPTTDSNQCNVFFDDAEALVCSAPAAPTSPAASPPTICSGASSTLSASVGSGETVDWYAGSCGGTLVGSGTSLSVSPTATTTYYPRARNTSTGCVSSSCGNTVTVTVNPPPVAPTSASASPASICSGSSTTLTATGGSADPCKWYVGTCGGTLVGTGTSIVASPASTTTYYARRENACGNSSCVSTTVTVSGTAPTASAGGPQTIDFGGTTAPLGGNTPAPPATGQWSIVSGGTGTFSSTTDPNATFTHTGGSGPIVLRWTVSLPPCAPATADVTITVRNCCLYNGDFDQGFTGDIGTGWTKQTPESGTWAMETTIKRSGSASQKITDAAGAPAFTTWLYQTVSVKPGRTYVPTMWIYRLNAGVPRIGVDPDGGTSFIAGDAATPQNQWSYRVNDPFTAGTGGVATIGIAAGWQTNSGTVYFDDVSIEPQAPQWSGGTTTIYAGQSATLTAGGGFGGDSNELCWYTGPGGTGTKVGTGTSLIVWPTSTTTYYPRWETSGNCGISADGAAVTVTVLPPANPPTVTSITPSSGPNTGTTSITNLAGTGFVSGASVRLKRTGYSDVTASSVVVQGATKITCSLNLTGRKTGLWNVVVTNPDAQSGTLTNGFGITISDTSTVFGTTIKSLLDTVATSASLNHRFCVWGLVELIDSSTFWLDDGSGTKIKVFAPGYTGITNGKYASAIGTVDVSSVPPILVGRADRIVTY